MTKQTWLAISSVALAAALAGCGSNGTSSSGGSPTPSADRQDLQVKYAQCMRKNGVDMPDPKPGEGVTIRIDKGSQGKLEVAQKACKEFSPMREGGPGQSAEDRDHAVKMAECLRRNGLEVEIPKAGQAGRIRSLKGDEKKTKQAMETCNREVPRPSPKPAG
jgi:hypothetical protein